MAILIMCCLINTKESLLRVCDNIMPRTKENTNGEEIEVLRNRAVSDMVGKIPTLGTCRNTRNYNVSTCMLRDVSGAVK